MKAFCKANESLLSSKKIGIFLCCGFQEQFEEYLSSNFPPSLRKNAVIKCFGGEARTEKMKAFDKMIMKAAMKRRGETLKISSENIECFSKAIQVL